jgi:O-acetyl-ADP-ribose deacetylase (regulator of RNase III)
MTIELLRADIASIKVDAIVNASQHEHVDGVGKVPAGNAVITSGGNLLCKFIIHAVGPRPDDADADRTLRNATLSALERAEELAIGSVAFTSTRSGLFGMAIERSAPVMIKATLDFRRRARSLQRVIYGLFGPEQYEAFRKWLEELDR